MLECSTDSQPAGSIVASLWRVLNAPDVTARHGIKSRLFRALVSFAASNPAFSARFFSRKRSEATSVRPPVTDGYHLTVLRSSCGSTHSPPQKFPVNRPQPSFQIRAEAPSAFHHWFPPTGCHPVRAGHHRVGADFAVRPERFSPPTRFSPPVRAGASAGTAAGCRCARYRFHHSRMGLAMAIEE